ncbi:LacI family DNA-binding transcriptional regulator [Gracilibacillus alcaliphilus]|uniref:LacI family DNA-binding transcriptional regulator n=1 Tax=Gracilibacillus alcaliphilus TaxID=1401441 RepID=UPI003B835458
MAKRANVSVSTVSRVLNNSKYVSEDLKKRVLEVVHETGYKPNLVARGLVNKKTHLIGVLIPRISNNFFSKLIEGIEGIAQAYGYNILLSTSNNDIEKELEYLNIFQERQLDGIIFSVTQFTEQHQQFFEQTAVPAVYLGQRMENQSKYPFVTIDNIKAAYEATRYLIQQNHEQIAILAGPESDKATCDHRLQGYIEALEEAGLPVQPAWQTKRFHTIADGYHAAAHIMSQSEKPTAIFACSDQQALGAINYLHEHGYNVPNDISVMGFDDIDLATVFSPKLSTVKQKPVDSGAVAMELMMDQLEGRSIYKMEHLVPYRVVVRESTGSL